MPRRNTVEIVISATDKASKVLDQVGRSSQTLGKVALAGIAGGAVAATGAVLGLGAGITKMTLSAAAVEGTASTFEALAESVGSDATQALEQLRQSTRGMVADADLMAAGNKFMAMGLAESSEEAGKLAEIATQLGMAMGEDATASMENFALMLANQSIPRLDSFGISSGKVRERINELMEADESLTRETAFMTAVMEQSEATMAKVGEQGETTAASMARINSSMQNTALGIGRQFLPVLGQLLKPIADLVERLGPMLIEWAGKAAEWLGPILSSAVEKVTGFIDGLINVLDPLIKYLLFVVQEGDALNDWLTHLPEPLQGVAETVGRVIAAFGNFWAVLRDYGPLMAIGEILDDFIPEETMDAIWGILMAVQDFMSTVANAVAKFVSWKDVLIAVGIGIASVLVPAVIGLVASLAPLIAGVAAIVGAIALLRNAWERDWGGMRTKLLELWDAAGPVIESIVAWFQGAIPKAVAFARSTFELLASLWQSTIQPAVAELGAAFAELWAALVGAWNSIKPIFAELGQAFGASGGKALEFADVVKAAVGMLVVAIKVLAAIVKVAAKIIGGAAQLIAKFWNKHGKAVVKILGFILKGFKKTFGDIYKVIDKVLKAIGKLVKKYFGKSIIVDAILGGLDRIKKGFEAVTKAIEKIWKAFWETLEDIADKFTRLIERLVDAFLEALEKLFEAITRAIERIWEGFWDTLESIADKVSRAIERLVEAFLETLEKLFETITRAIERIWDSFWDTLEDIADRISKAIENLVEAFLEALERLFDTITSAIEKIWDDFWSALETIADNISRAIENLIEAFLDALESLFDSITSSIEDIWDDFWSALEDIADSISDTIEGIVDGFLSAIENAFDAATSAIKSVWEAAWNAIQSVVSSITTAIEGIVNSFLSAIEGAFNTVTTVISNVWDTAWQAIQAVVETVTTTIQTVVSDAWAAVQSTFETVLGTDENSGLRGLVKTVFDAIDTKISDIMDSIKTTTTSVWSAIKTAFTSGLQTLIDSVNAVISALNAFIDIANQLPGINIPNIGEIPDIQTSAAGARGLTTTGLGGTNLGGITFNTTINTPMDEEEFMFRVQEALRGLS